MSDRFELRLEVDMLSRIDAWRAKRASPPSRSEAIRRLIERGLNIRRREQSFESMRLQVLVIAKSGLATGRHWEAYAFAWAERVFPILHESEDFHEAFASGFRVSAKRLEKLQEILDDAWSSKKTLSFYELEQRLGKRHGGSWERRQLIIACRYLYLCGQFDKEFWSALVQTGEAPTEVKAILRSWDRDRLIVY